MFMLQVDFIVEKQTQIQDYKCLRGITEFIIMQKVQITVRSKIEFYMTN